MNLRAPVLAPLAMLALLVLGSCGGGGGGGEVDPPPPDLGVFTGFSDAGNLDWESTGGGDGGVGAGADGGGGVGGGGDFGQFRGANVCVFLDNGTQLGCALTDNTKGMVTIKPGRDYKGGLRIELTGTPTATYYEEGRDTYVPFPPDRKIRVWVPAIARNIGITPFTEAAYRLLTEGSAPESVGSAAPTKEQIRAANERVRLALNEHFPTALHVDDIARLPFIKSQGLPAGSMKTDPRGRYGLVNGAFSKQASFHNGDTTTPTLDAVRLLAEDLLDGRIDGRNGDQPAGRGARTYDPNTLTGELTSALAEQAARFGAQEALDALPKLLNFGNVRYEGYLFDGSISKTGSANSTVAGWVGANTRNFTTGQQFDRLPGRRALALFSNNGHGGGFYKADVNGPRHKVFAIGDNVNGELGLGTRGSTNAQAVEVAFPGAPSHIVGGFAHSVARMADGTVWAWGDNSSGQLGQNNAGLANSLVPLQVTLPVSAVAVAATNLTSYALGVDGKVYAWGANGGFGLLGNGSADGVALAPIEVAGLSGIVQISARDNDVVVVRRDNTVWQWGSHPADASAFVPGDPAAPYLGGTRSPTQINGLPAGQAVRKILTEQGLFAALLSNGHVYTWGVHFDITAGQVLRTPAQLNATRMLGLPPIRDMMPGGFQGYGARAFDRLTAMGVDYDGGMWKIRGRVGEVFDPDTEASRAAQRRPQGQGPRVDCETCHTFLDQPLSQIKAASRQPTSGPECVPTPSVHSGLSASLIHTETDCVLCHNPARLNNPVNTPSGSIPFAANGGWPDCVKPAGLPNRTSIPPAIISNACEIPPRHVFTPPGTVCASCHNSVVARPLRELSTACAQPRSNELPTIPTTAAIAGAFTAAGAQITVGSITSASRHELRGTLSAPLAAGQSIAVQRKTTLQPNGELLGTAAYSAGTTWTFAVSGAPEGANSYRTQVVAGSGFGAFSTALSFTVDSTPPAAVAAVSGFTDDVLGTIAIGGFAGDATPVVNGTLTSAPGSGETVQVLRDGSVVGTATVSALTWSYTEPAALVAGTYAYQARVIDTATNTSPLSAAANLTIVAGVPTASITQAVNDASVVIANGATTTDATPTLSGTVSSALPTGYALRLLRNGNYVRDAVVTNTTWVVTDSVPSDGTWTYTVQVDAGAVIGAASAAYILTVDTVPPTQTANVTSIADDFQGTLTVQPFTTIDTTPALSGTLSAPLGTNEVVQVRRGTTVVGNATMTGAQSWTFTEQVPGVSVTPPATSATVTYSARVVDAAGQVSTGLPGSTITVTISPGSFPLQGARATVTTVNGQAPTNPRRVSYTVQPVIGGTLQRALASGEVVSVYRNTALPVVSGTGACPSGAAVGSVTAAQLGINQAFSIPTSTVSAATYFYVARVEQAGVAANCGESAGSVSTQVVAPLVANATGLLDPNGVNIAGGNTTLAPRVSGTLSAALRTGETLQILRTPSGGATTTLTPTTVSGTNWTYNEPAAPAVGLYSYTARTVDSNVPLNLGGTGAALSVNVIALPAVNSIQVTGVNAGGFVNTATPTVNGTLSAVLPAGAVVRVYRATGANTCTTVGIGGCNLVGPAGTTGASWTLPDADVGQGIRRYKARVESGSAYGNPSAEVAITVDSVPPTSATIIGAFSDVMPNTAAPSGPVWTPNGASIANNGTTNDVRPTLRVQLGGALQAGESIQVMRGTSEATLAVVAPVSGPVNDCGPNCYSLVVDSTITLPVVADPLPASVTGGTRAFAARVIDAAGNLGTRSSAYTITFDLLGCDINRANYACVNRSATALCAPQTGVAPNTGHAAWAGLACVNCHLASTGTPTPSGGFVLVPYSAPTYWCRRP